LRTALAEQSCKAQMIAHQACPVKVVRIIARLNVGGPARHVVLLSEALSRQGYDTLLVHGSIDGGEASLEHLAASRGLRTRKIPALGRRIRPIRDLVALAALLRVLFTEAPDVVHTHTAKAGFLGRLAALLYNLTRSRASRCVVVHTFHGNVLTGYFTKPGSWLVQRVERASSMVTDCVVAISPSQRQELVEELAVATSEQTTVIPLGLNLAPYLVDRSRQSARDRLDLDPQDFVIGYIGRFVPIKALDRLVSAFAIVVRSLPGSVLVFAGDGPTRAQVEALAIELHVRDRIKFLGWTDDVAGIYAAIDVCCVSSLNEGTPVALIEAMAAQVPVVATRVGGVMDLIEDGRTGILVPPDAVDALAQALLRLASDPELRQRLGEAGRAGVTSKYAVDRLANDIHMLYQGQLHKKRRAAAERAPGAMR
jgi:glycosyltransferase involved in cell wall biosynthesis